jgi:hypothetical protein
MEYEYVIVGAGPAGLTLAYLLAKSKNKVIIVEKARTIGGCHRVERVTSANLFSDHGPRVYSTSYVNFIHILQDMGINFSDFFVKYKSNFTQNINLTIKEIACLSLEFIKFLMNSNHGRRTSMKSFCEQYNFSEAGEEYIDLICRLSDGADYSRYTLYQFLAVINYQMFYPLYQPKKPLDEVFFPEIQRRLENLGVVIKTDTEIERCVDGKAYTYSGEVYKGQKIILAIPLEMVAKIHRGYSQMARETAYMKYVHIMLHWDTIFDTTKINTSEYSQYGILYIVQSLYTTFKENQSKVVVSSIITKPDTVKGMSTEQIKNLILDHLTSIDPKVPRNVKAILYPGNFINSDGEWDNTDTSFVLTPNSEFIDFETDTEGLFILGPYNRYSSYPATTLESSVCNAIKLYNILEKNNIRILSAWNFRNILCILLLILIKMDFGRE